MKRLASVLMTIVFVVALVIPFSTDTVTAESYYKTRVIDGETQLKATNWGYFNAKAKVTFYYKTKKDYDKGKYYKSKISVSSKNIVGCTYAPAKNTFTKTGMNGKTPKGYVTTYGKLFILAEGEGKPETVYTVNSQRINVNKDYKRVVSGEKPLKATNWGYFNTKAKVTFYYKNEKDYNDGKYYKKTISVYSTNKLGYAYAPAKNTFTKTGMDGKTPKGYVTTYGKLFILGDGKPEAIYTVKSQKINVKK